MKVFFDTSALVKRYVEEVGSAKVQALCEQADDLIVSVICLPEMLSSFNRLRREEKLSDEQYQVLKEELEQDINDTTVCYLDAAVLEQAIVCLELYPLRAMDALHLGCALIRKPDCFVSSDVRQLEAAAASGLNTINPEISEHEPVNREKHE